MHVPNPHVPVPAFGILLSFTVKMACAIICYGQALGSWVASRQKKPWKWVPVRLKLSAKRTIRLERVENIVSLVQNRRVNVQLIADTVGIRTGIIETILCENCWWQKSVNDWSHACMTRKWSWCRTWSENLNVMQLDFNLFLTSIVTDDETLIYCYDHESKQQST